MDKVNFGIDIDEVVYEFWAVVTLYVWSGSRSPVRFPELNLAQEVAVHIT